MMLVGRLAELARVDALLADARDGRAGSLVVRGEAGIGKTALLGAAVERATGFRVLRHTGIESECGVTFGGLSGLLRRVLPAIDALSQRQRDALLGALGVQPPTLDAGTVAMAVLDLFSQLADAQPVLIVCDDLQWVDGGTVDALLFAARRLAEEGVVVLFGLRSPAVIQTRGVPEIQLTGLPPADSRRLIDEVGTPGGQALRERILADTGGNPLAIFEASSWAAVEQPEHDAPLRFGDVLEAAVGERLLPLSGPARTALALAAFDSSGDLEPVVEAMRIMELDVQALAEAESADLVQIHPGRISFRHPLIRAVAQGEQSGERRRQLHAALAVAHAAAGREESAVWHRSAAAFGADDTVATALEGIAEIAVVRGDVSTAARAFHRSAVLSSRTDDRARRLLAAGRTSMALGPAALPVLEEAIATATAPEVVAEAEFCRILLLTWSGRLAEVATTAPAVAQRISAVDPTLAAVVTGLGLIGHWLSVEPWSTSRLAQANWRSMRDSGLPLEGYGIVPSIAYGLSSLMAGLPALDVIGDCGRAIEAGGPPALASPVATILLAAGDYRGCRAALDSALPRARASGDIASVAWMQAFNSWLLADTGDVPGARAAGAESMDLGAWAAGPLAVGLAAGRRALIEAMAGDVGACRSYAEVALSSMTMHEDASVGLLAQQGLALLELGTGRPDRSIALLEPIVGRLRLAGTRTIGVFPALPDLIESLTLVGRAGETAALMLELEEIAGDDHSALARGRLGRTRGICAAEPLYQGHFEAATAIFDDAGAVFDLGRTRLAFGRRLLRSGRSGLGREIMSAAADTFGGMGALSWAELAGAELATGNGDVGLDSAKVHETADISLLTAREYQIAMLAATGASTQEMAAALFLSPKTVEAHLTRVFRKVQVRSKAQLAHRLSAVAGRGP